MTNNKEKIFETMVSMSQMLTNDDLLEASSALTNVVNKITNGPQWDLREHLSDEANDLLDKWDSLAQQAQTYTDEYNSPKDGLGELDESKDETYDVDAKVQKIINKLIAEEVIAHDFYIACCMAARKDEANEFRKMFISTAVDELDDHRNGIAQWAMDNGYSVPFKYKDYRKYSDKKLFDLLDKLKPGKDAKSYVEDAILSENLAIESYEDAMKYDGVPYELHALLMKNYYDEQQHLDDLQTLRTAVEANTHLSWY